MASMHTSTSRGQMINGIAMAVGSTALAVEVQSVLQS